MNKRFPSLPSWLRNTLYIGAVASALLLSWSSACAHESGENSPSTGRNLLPATILQLESARQAAAKYFDVSAATKDGYVDIDVIIPHMGRHLLNPHLLDDHFDPEKPELLVYQENGDGSLRLVAVEYAIPTDLSAKAPHGFVGSNDVWFKDTGFQLWTLHAWVYDFNPDGVFAPSNPRVP